jgi:hypothetical protein
MLQAIELGGLGDCIRHQVLVGDDYRGVRAIDQFAEELIAGEDCRLKPVTLVAQERTIWFPLRARLMVGDTDIEIRKKLFPTLSQTFGFRAFVANFVGNSVEEAPNSTKLPRLLGTDLD